MFVALQADVVFGFVLIAFIDEVEGCRIIMVLLWAVHIRSVLLLHVVQLSLSLHSVLHDDGRMEVRESPDDVVVGPAR